MCRAGRRNRQDRHPVPERFARAGEIGLHLVELLSVPGRHNEVALPVWRVPACEPVDQSIPFAPANPPASPSVPAIGIAAVALSSESSADSRTSRRLAPLRVRRIRSVRLHVDLTVLAKLACRLANERVPAVAA
jgi:hypothetical protein